MKPDEYELSDDDEIAVCAECGTEVEPETERGFRIGERAALCFECAVERGGTYDETEERWLEPPDLEGLDAEWD
jgi:hypothetical protein